MSVDDANRLRDEGLRLFEEGSYDEALETFERARQAFSDSDELLLAGEMLNNVGVIHRLQGRHEEALAVLGQALDLFRQGGDRSRAAQTLGNLGALHSARDDYEQAEACYREAIDIFGALGDGDRQGETYMALGLLQFRLGRRTEGLAAYEAGLLAVKKPTARQRTWRTLLKVRQRLLGG